MTTQMKYFTDDNFEAMYARLRNEDGMMTVMSRMQAAYGIHERKAYENSEAMIRLVAAHENAVNMLMDDSQAVLDAFLNESAFMGGYTRKVFLHQMYFGLKMYQDEALIEKIKEGAAESALFHEYYTQYGEDPSITEAMLEAEVRKMMGNYRVSPEAMRYIVKQMEQNQSLWATASELGEEGMRFKTIVAMDLYLRNQDTMTMEEAAHIACTNVDLQAMADGLAHGQITEERAKLIIAAIVLLCVVASGTVHFYHIPRAAKEVAKLSNLRAVRDGLLYGGFALAAVNDKVIRWMGEIAAKRTFVRTVEEANTAAAMEAMISRMEATDKQTAPKQAPAREAQIETQAQQAKAYL